MHCSAGKVLIAPSPDALEWSGLSNIPRSVISYNLKPPRAMCDAPFALNWCNSAYSIRSSVATPVMHLSVVSWRGSSTSRVWMPAALRALKGWEQRSIILFHLPMEARNWRQREWDLTMFHNSLHRIWLILKRLQMLIVNKWLRMSERMSLILIKQYDLWQEQLKLKSEFLLKNFYKQNLSFIVTKYRFWITTESIDS